MTFIPYLVLALLVFAGLAVLGRRRPISREEYEERKGKGSGVGNAVVRGAGAMFLELHGILEPGREQIRKLREERRAEKEGEGDPPVPGEKDPESSRESS